MEIRYVGFVGCVVNAGTYSTTCPFTHTPDINVPDQSTPTTSFLLVFGSTLIDRRRPAAFDPKDLLIFSPTSYTVFVRYSSHAHAHTHTCARHVQTLVPHTVSSRRRHFIISNDFKWCRKVCKGKIWRADNRHTGQGVRRHSHPVYACQQHDAGDCGYRISINNPITPAVGFHILSATEHKTPRHRSAHKSIRARQQHHHTWWHGQLEEYSRVYDIIIIYYLKNMYSSLS